MSAARHSLEVVSNRPLSPNLRRITFSGPELQALLPQRPAPSLRLFVPHQDGPVARPYTVRAVNAGAREFSIDFAVCADGPASTWALSAQPGERLECSAPRAGFEYRPDIDWYLLIGDATALPAIAAIVETMPAGTPVLAMIETPTARDRQPLNSDAFLLCQWFSREERWLGPSLCLEESIALLTPRRSRGRAWIAGEAERVRQLRGVVQSTLRLDPADIATSGYWKYGVAAHEELQ